MSEIRAGFARECITPPLGDPISGYYIQRFTKGVIDDLYVTAVAFDDGKNKSVVLAVDIIMIGLDMCNAYRKMIADYCDIPFECVMVNCSHTHTGPMLGKDFASDICGSKHYEEFLGIKMRDAAAYALSDLQPAKMCFARGEAKNISFVRRFRMKDGSVQTNPGVNNPNIDHALGTPNETVKLIKLERECAEDIYIVNFGTHPDTVGGDYISADYPGYVCSTVENAIPGVKCMFLLAPQGDVNHVNTNPTEGFKKGLHDTFDGCPRGIEHAKYMGRVIAGAVLQICDKAEDVAPGEIKFVEKTVVIPSNQENDKLEEAKKIVALHECGREAETGYEAMELTTVVAEAHRIVALENGPDSYQFAITAIKIGDTAFVGIPGEPFTELANRIYDGSPFTETILCCCTNGGETYFPASSAYDEGGYEARSSYLKKGGDDIVVNGVLDMLKELKNM